MMDMGWAEIGVLFVLALLIFGPDKLPKLATDAAGMIRKLRELAQNAQSGLTDQGIDVQGIKTDLQSVAELHPKKIVGSVVSDFNAVATPTAGATATSTSTTSEPASAEPATSARTTPATPKAISETKNVPLPSTKFDPDAT